MGNNRFIYLFTRKTVIYVRAAHTYCTFGFPYWKKIVVPSVDVWNHNVRSFFLAQQRVTADRSGRGLSSELNCRHSRVSVCMTLPLTTPRNASSILKHFMANLSKTIYNPASTLVNRNNYFRLQNNFKSESISFNYSTQYRIYFRKIYNHNSKISFPLEIFQWLEYIP